MTRKKPPKEPLNIRAILESPVGSTDSGRKIAAYEAGRRRLAESACQGDMAAASRFLADLQRYGLIEIPEAVDDHRYLERIPKEWEPEVWIAMYNHHGPPLWPGEHDGLIPLERWSLEDGPRPKRRRRS